ncbi:ribosome silencing factor [Lacibacter sediminis]|uniref:Ribosomal silencing factor RsfS n=1 Tax=Lacibacter sediminis TaxID=2760713 RepID=A0A7G5XFA1_9BACT|nr:ribosome silencing factor [Lacibacter sediminis]QNA44154.1 ribosome silencing factor [Lacibacter sediminis]
MSTLSLLNNRSKDSKSTTARINRNSKLFKTIIRAIQEKKGENVISLDLRKIPEAVSDFFIICEAGSTTQVKAIADHVEYLVKEECGEGPYRHEGMSALQWVLVDYVNVVVHIFHPETRKFYRLEEMWSDAAAADHE